MNMSLKRYAILAAVSYHNNQQHNQNATMTMPMTTIGATTTTTTAPTATQSTQQQQYEVLTTMGTLFMSSSAASASASASTNNNNNNTNSSSSSSNVSNSQASNSLTNYYGGGLGLFHQQNLRGSTGLLNGISSGNGHMGGNSYTNVVNGNVNLLLGGAMLSLVTTILCVVCYCCHRNIKKRTEAAYRQQRQWLDNDPNMEIYSVEQCYETAGLFLGDSTDGLATMPTLHHEPPPSYDAVLLHEQQLLQQQQQQQQQQLLLQHELQRSSPPPGYRSLLDVSNLVVTNALTHGRGIPDGQMAICELSAPIAELCAAGSSSSNSSNNYNNNGLAAVAAAEGVTALQAYNNNSKQLTNARGNAMNTSNTVLNMKKVLNAQSCCSLQRAEVENMWNAAAAALAARGGVSSNNGVNGNSSNTEMNALTPPLMRCTRRTLDCYGGSSGSGSVGVGGTRLPVNELGKRYWNHNYYRRGCPLCGKFRYDAEDVLCASTESGLDNLMATATTTTTTLTTSAGMATANMSASNERLNVNIADGRRQHNRNYYDDDDDANDNCTGCNAAAAYAAANNAVVATAAGQPAYVVDAATNDMPSIEDEANACSNNNNNENDTNGNNSSAIASISVDNIDENANANNTRQQQQQQQQQEQQQEADISTVAGKDLNAINDNGIICLDMSKIIDKTGLPTYEGAIKLESSGYV